jgi:hypothetical protein
MRYADDFPLRDQQVTTEKTGTEGEVSWRLLRFDFFPP